MQSALNHPQEYTQVGVSLDQEQHNPSSDTTCRIHSSPQTQLIGCKAYLVTESMTTNYNRINPARDRTRNPPEDDGLTENSSSKNITDLYKMVVDRYWEGIETYSAIRALPHGFEIEFFDTSLVRCDRRTFDTDFVFLDSKGGVESDLVTGLARPKLGIVNCEDGRDGPGLGTRALDRNT